MNQEIKKLIEEAIEKRVEKICEFYWQRVFRKEVE